MDRRKQYTSELYREALSRYEIFRSMNNAAGRCYDNARYKKYVGEDEIRTFLLPWQKASSILLRSLSISFGSIHELLEQPENLLID